MPPEVPMTRLTEPVLSRTGICPVVGLVTWTSALALPTAITTARAMIAPILLVRDILGASLRARPRQSAGKDAGRGQWLRLSQSSLRRSERIQVLGGGR